MRILILTRERVVFSLSLPLVPIDLILSILGDPGIILYHCQTHKNVKKMPEFRAKILERSVSHSVIKYMLFQDCWYSVIFLSFLSVV